MFTVGGFAQCHGPGRAGIQVLGEALDCSALAGGIPALEDDHVPELLVLAPVLELQQFNLQPVFLQLVLLAGHPLLVGVVFPPRLHGRAAGVDQFRVLALPPTHRVPHLHQMVDGLTQVFPEPALILGCPRPVRLRHPGLLPAPSNQLPAFQMPAVFDAQLRS